MDLQQLEAFAQHQGIDPCDLDELIHELQVGTLRDAGLETLDEDFLNALGQERDQVIGGGLSSAVAWLANYYGSPDKAHMVLANLS